MSNQEEQVDLDISFTKLPRLIFAFNRFYHDKSSNIKQLVEISLESLNLMDKYKGLNSCYQTMISVLNTQQIDHKFNDTWVKSIIDSNEQLVSEVKGFKVDEEEVDDENPFQTVNNTNSESRLLKFDKLRQIFIVYFLQNAYQTALQYLNQIGSLINFASQPNDQSQLASNKYIELLFYQAILQFFSQLGFPNVLIENKQRAASFSLNNLPLTLPTNKSTPSQHGATNQHGTTTQKNFMALIKKLTFYYTKNEILFNSIQQGSISVENVSSSNNSNNNITGQVKNDIIKELKFYWLIKWLLTIISFKQNNIHEFLTQFYEISIANSKIPEVRPFDILIDDFEFKSEILTLICFSSVLNKSFKDLSFIETTTSNQIENKFDDAYLEQHKKDMVNQQLVDLFSSSNDLGSEVYELLINLSHGNARLVKNFLNDKNFIQNLDCSVGYLLPVSNLAKPNSTQSASDFTKYLQLIIDFKFFLLMMSITKQIPRLKLIDKLGYDTEDSAQVKVISGNLLNLLSCLNLGEMNLGYNANDEIFYNLGTNNHRSQVVKQGQLHAELADLQQSLEGESLANIMKGILTDKFFN